MIWNRPMFH